MCLKSLKVQKMRLTRFLRNDESGSAIVLAIMILVIVSIIGIESSNTSSLEVQIASAERDAKINFYRAEGAAMEAAQRVQNAIADDLRSRAAVWLNGDAVDLEDTAQWNYDNSGTDDTAEQSTIDANAFYGVIDAGITARTSLDMTQLSQLHTFRVFGRYVATNQGSFVEMGYRKRF
jgi:Tfp pilus assembly protein PilX